MVSGGILQVSTSARVKSFAISTVDCGIVLSLPQVCCNCLPGGFDSTIQ
jgi:hypothetical protein